MTTTGAELYFCVDGGGTRSRGCVLDAEGRTLAEASGGPCNPNTNLQRAVASIVEVWRQCCSAVGRPNDRYEGVVFAIGAAGLYLDGGKDLLAACPPFARFCSMSDGYAALIGAGSGAPCSLLIVGTGIAGHRLYANGWSIQRDAWGWIVGDRGSGAWIGQKALRHFFAALDGVAPEDGLSRAVIGAIGGLEKLRKGWLRDLGPDRLAAFAPLVLEQAEMGVEFGATHSRSRRRAAGRVDRRDREPRRAALCGGRSRGAAATAPFGKSGPAHSRAERRRAGRLLAGREWRSPGGASASFR